LRIFGVDFTSRPTPRKPITVAECRLGEDLVFNRILALPDFAAFERFLAQPGPWIAGFDFPFAQSRRFVENIGWPRLWPETIAHVATLTRPAFRAVLEDYKRPRPMGDREHSRTFERGTGAASPQKLYGVPVALMFYEGARRLLAAGLNIPGLRPGDPSRTAYESYPGVAARALLGSRAPYKSDTRAKQSPDQLAHRRAILTALTGPLGQARFGFRARAPATLADDPTADSLDALLCAAQAAWAYRQQPDLSHMDPLEGWIADPSLFP
jgi:hypothetical protein